MQLADVPVRRVPKANAAIGCALPEAMKPVLMQGPASSAFTAAECSVNRVTGVDCVRLQIGSLLSFPPDASCWSSNDHRGSWSSLPGGLSTW